MPMPQEDAIHWHIKLDIICIEITYFKRPYFRGAGYVNQNLKKLDNWEAHIAKLAQSQDSKVKAVVAILQ